MKTNELPALPEPRLWYDSETRQCSSMVPLRPTYDPLFDPEDMRAYARQALADRERQAGEEGRYRLAPPEYQTPEYHASVLEAVRAGRITYAPGWNEPPSPDGKAEQRPQNCGTGYCSCIECPFKAEQAEAPNQCDGCAIGAPINGWGNHEYPDGSLMGCTKNRYATKPTASIEQAEAPSDAEMVCAEAYQVVGSLLSDLGQFETERARKILDNLSDAKMVHSDVLPWPSFATQPTASNAGEQKDVGCGLNPHYAGNFDEETAELADLRRSLASEIDRLRTALASKPPAGEQKPFAWATFDGEGSYDLRLFEDNEDYREQFIKRNGPQYTSWVLQLYLGPQPEQVALDREHAENYRLIRRGQHWSVIDGIGNTLQGEDLDAAVDAIRAARARGEGERS